MVTPTIVNFGLQKGGDKEDFPHTTVVHQHKNTIVKHDIYTRTVIYVPNSPIRPVYTLQGSETEAFTQ